MKGLHILVLMIFHRRADEVDYAASFGYLATEAAEVDGDAQEADSISKAHPLPSSKPSTVVFTWGLNDKDQLGGIKGSKIKVPTLSESLSKLNVAQVAGTSFRHVMSCHTLALSFNYLVRCMMTH